MTNPVVTMHGKVQMALTRLLTAQDLTRFPKIGTPAVPEDLSNTQTISMLCEDLYRFFNTRPEQQQPQVLQALFDAKDADGQQLLQHALAGSLWSRLRPEQKHNFAMWLLDQDHDEYFHDFFRHHDLLSLGEALSLTDDQGDSLCHALCRSKLEPAIIAQYLQALWHSGHASTVMYTPNHAGQTPLMLALASCGDALPKADDPCVFLFALMSYDASTHRHLRLHCSSGQQLLLCYHANQFDYLRCMKQALGQIEALASLLVQTLNDENIIFFQSFLSLVHDCNHQKSIQNLKKLLAKDPPELGHRLLDYVRSRSLVSSQHNRGGANPLEIVILSGNDTFLSLILASLQKHECDVFISNDAYSRWLCVAAGRGLLAMVRLLFNLCRDDRRLSIDYLRRHQDPLDYAIYGGQMDVISYLIDDCGFDVNQVKRTPRNLEAGPTSIAFAILSGRPQVLQYLIKVGTEVHPTRGHYFKRCHHSSHQVLPGCAGMASDYLRHYGQLKLSPHSDPPACIKNMRYNYASSFKKLQNVKKSMMLLDDQWVKNPHVFSNFMSVLKHANVFAMSFDDVSQMVASIYNRLAAIKQQFFNVSFVYDRLFDNDRRSLSVAALYDRLQISVFSLSVHPSIVTDLNSSLDDRDRHTDLAQLYPRIRQRVQYCDSNIFREPFTRMVRQLSVLDGYLASRLGMDPSFCHRANNLIMSAGKSPLSYLIWSFVGMDADAINRCYLAVRLRRILQVRLQQFSEMAQQIEVMLKQLAYREDDFSIVMLDEVIKGIRDTLAHLGGLSSLSIVDERFFQARRHFLYCLVSAFENLEKLFSEHARYYQGESTELTCSLYRVGQSTDLVDFSLLKSVVSDCQIRYQQYQNKFEGCLATTINISEFTHAMHALDARLHWLMTHLIPWVGFLRQRISNAKLMLTSILGEKRCLNACHNDDDVFDEELSDEPWWDSFYGDAKVATSISPTNSTSHESISPISHVECVSQSPALQGYSSEFSSAITSECSWQVISDDFDATASPSSLDNQMRVFYSSRSRFYAYSANALSDASIFSPKRSRVEVEIQTDQSMLP